MSEPTVHVPVLLEQVVRWLVGWGVERRDALIAVGGGVITDLVGFAASVTLRGIPWIAVPTSLLGMVDAAVGGKTGIDPTWGRTFSARSPRRGRS